MGGGRHVIQRAFWLDPVGLDTNGAVKPLKDLSYAPDSNDTYGGFGKKPYRWIDFFQGLLEATPITAAHSAADKSVFKWYRLPVDYLHFLPLLKDIVSTIIDDDGEKRRDKPWIEIYTNARWPSLDVGPTLLQGIVDESEYEIDAKFGIVKFHEAKSSDPGADDEADITPASVKGTFAYRSCGSSGVGPNDFYSYSAGSGQLEEVLYRPKMILYGIYNDMTQQVDWKNLTELDAQAADLISSIDPGAAWFTSRTGRFPAIKAIELDGRMRSITYHVGRDGAYTRCQWNMEFPRPGAPSAGAKRRRAQLARQERLVQRQEAETQ